MEKNLKKQNNDNNILKVLSELICISSYGKIEKSHSIIKYLKNKFNKCREIVELEDTNGNVHLLIGVNCNLKDISDCIMLSGHIDTVRESKGHLCDVSVLNDEIIGLGTSDMKSFIASIIVNIDNLKLLDIPVVLSITSDEETDLYGIEKIIQELIIRNIYPNLTIVGEPTNLDYYISNRGNSIYTSIMKGKSCHSSTPQLGINAIENIAQFILEIKKISELYRKYASICITHINGGKKPSNIVPDECSISFEIRTSYSKILTEIYNYILNKHNEISQCYGDSILYNVFTIPPFEKRNNEFLLKQTEIYDKKMLDAPYTTEAGYFQNAFPTSNIIIYGPGNPDCIHKAGESISISNLLQYEKELIQLLNNYLSYSINERKDIKKLVHRKKN